jgi:hypothetical protein
MQMRQDGIEAVGAEALFMMGPPQSNKKTKPTIFEISTCKVLLAHGNP